MVDKFTEKDADLVAFSSEAKQHSVHSIHEKLMKVVRCQPDCYTVPPDVQIPQLANQKSTYGISLPVLIIDSTKGTIESIKNGTKGMYSLVFS